MPLLAATCAERSGAWVFRSTLEPYNAKPTDDVTAVTGRPAHSFTDWAKAHRAAFPTPGAVQDAATIEESR